MKYSPQSVACRISRFCLSIILAAITALPASLVAQPRDEASGPPPGFVVKPPTPAERPDREFVSWRPELPDEEQWEIFFGNDMVRNVTRPGIYPLAPPKNVDRQETVIVIPGGGYNFVSTGNEGFPVAEQLAAAGYFVALLKYRTVKTPRDPEGFLKETSKVFRNLGKERPADHPPAVDDFADAIRYLQSHCEALGCNGDAIGAIGFSAGARTIMRGIENRPAAASLDHLALIYPPTYQTISGGPRPPAFVAIAADDPLFRQGGFILLEGLLAETSNVEFHLYVSGGHGFGTQKKNVTAADWPSQYLNWLNLTTARP